MARQQIFLAGQGWIFGFGARRDCIAPSLTDTPLAAQLLPSELKHTAMAERHPYKTNW